MKTICDWNNCFELGNIEHQLRKITVKILDYYALNMLKNLIKTGTIFQV